MLNRRILSIALIVSTLFCSHLFIASTALFNKAFDFAKGKIGTTVKEKVKETAKEPIELKELPGFDTVTNRLPGEFKSFLASFVIHITEAEFSSEKFMFAGSVKFKGAEIFVEVRMEKAANTRLSFKLAIPKGWKFSETFSQLKNFDKLAINNLFILVSTYDYEYDQQYKDKKGKEQTRHIKVEKGATFNADIELTDAVKKLQELMEKLTKLECIVLEDFRTQFAGVIKPGADFTTSHFYINLPYKIGIDLTKKPISLKDPYVRRFYTAGFMADVDLALNTRLRTGFFLELKNEKNPKKPQVLQFLGEMEIDAKGGITITAWMEGIYEQAFGLSWLSIGPKLGFGAGIMAEPPWVKEIAITGGLSLGEVLKKASATVDVDLSNGNLLVDFAAEKLDIAELIRVMITIATKITPKNKNDLNTYKQKIPVIEFTNLKLQIVPVPMIVFGKSYSAGITAGGRVQIGKVKGSVDVNVKMDPSQIYALATLDPLEVKGLRGKTLFTIDGPGPDRKYGTPDDAALLEIDINATVPPSEQKIYIAGKLEIPPLKFEQQTEISLEQSKFHAAMSTTIEQYFSGKLDVEFDPKKPEDFMVDMSMDQKFAEVLRKKVKEEMIKFEQKAKNDLNKAQADVDQITEKMDELRKKRADEFAKLESGAAKKVKEYKDKVARLDREIARLEKECPGIPNPLKKACGDKIKKKAEKTGLEIATGVLSVGEKIVEGVEKAVNSIDNALKLDEAAQKIATAGLDIARGSVSAITKVTNALAKGLESFNIETARLVTSGTELKAGKLPKATLKIKIRKLTLDLKDIQFDVKNPGDFFKDVAKQLVTSVKSSIKK